MPICIAIKNDLLPCTHNARGEGTMCGTHATVHARHVAAAGENPIGNCAIWLGRNWCPREAAGGQQICTFHVGLRLRQIEAREREALITGHVRAVLARPVRPTWQEFVDEILQNHTLPRQDRIHVANRYFALVAEGVDIRSLHDRINWVLDGRPGAAPVALMRVVAGPEDFPQPGMPLPPHAPAAGNLARIAGDRQNVHTAVVSQQTNDAVRKLVAVVVPNVQQTERQMSVTWLTSTPPHGFVNYLRVINDIHTWFMMNTCRAENDQLYRRILRGLVALIERQPDDARRELYNRLWEECYESIGMCCEGHISRLCNVMVGFDDSFRPPVSIGELLQGKMAAIAGLDVPIEAKHEKANAVFEELGIPAAERVAWLEAF